MKTTLDLPDELVREMKLQAVIQGRTLHDLAADFLRQGLGMAPGPAAQAAPDSPPWCAWARTVCPSSAVVTTPRPRTWGWTNYWHTSNKH